MVNVIHLPPREPPKQLTAQNGVRHLHEHFLAFLNSNNPRGFAAEDVSADGRDGTEISLTSFTAEEIASIEERTILELLLDIAKCPSISERQFKMHATRIKRASNGVILHTRALELVSRAFGYSSWHEVKVRLKRTLGPIKNQTTQDRLKLKLFKTQ